MIPNIFVSSTIADLNYLRDGIREAIEELCYRPVMSEHGEVGYLNPNTAAESCYRSVGQCQMVILIVGKRYGSVGDDGLSVTHKEFLAAKEENVPIITFVSSHVLTHKGVYDAKPKADIWDDFPEMDNPRKTFRLLEEIAGSESFNGMIPFDSAANVKKMLKLQIADFVGQGLSGTIKPTSSQLRDVLAEITTVRNLLSKSSDELLSKEKDTKRYLAATRYLLNDSAAEYRKLLEKLFGDIDTAVDSVWKSESFPEVLKTAGFTHNVETNEMMSSLSIQSMSHQAEADEKGAPRAIYGHFGMDGGYVLYESNYLRISEGFFEEFDRHQKAIHRKATVT